MNSSIESRVENEFVKTTLLYNGEYGQNPVSTGPYHPRFEMFGLRMTIYLSQQREERRKDADVPAQENENNSGTSRPLSDYSFGEEHPRAYIRNGKEYVEHKRNTFKYMLRPPGASYFS